MEKKLYIAIGKNNEIRSTLFWAYNNFLNGKTNLTICLIHVHVPTQIRCSPRKDFPASVMAIREVEDKLYKELERQEVENMLDKYVQIIISFQVPSEKIYIEKESVADGILELISQLGIQKLVMGAGANSRFVGSSTKPASRKSNYVLQHAPDFCHIFFVSEARLIYASFKSLELTCLYGITNILTGYKIDIEEGFFG
ncbi:U-box domain-containing protein 33-like [Chenopodium quinoa]|uniref:U-box domain-containing protein 33-like n=1 Tax=Chenopodium quinoa TaxID=63459 RepID=UPI000B7911E7|nr:U-box domain-containing protein 33-like [Chenopodium quinoa]